MPKTAGLENPVNFHLKKGSKIGGFANSRTALGIYTFLSLWFST
jgi:hypothetical protein